MAINTNSSSTKNAPSSSTTVGVTEVVDSYDTTDLIELNMLQKRVGTPSSSGAVVAMATAAATTTSTTTPILKRKTGGGSKKLQFTTPEFSVTPIATIPGINTRLIPSRKR